MGLPFMELLPNFIPSSWPRTTQAHAAHKKSTKFLHREASPAPGSSGSGSGALSSTPTNHLRFTTYQSPSACQPTLLVSWRFISSTQPDVIAALRFLCPNSSCHLLIISLNLSVFQKVVPSYVDQLWLSTVADFFVI